MADTNSEDLNIDGFSTVVRKGRRSNKNISSGGNSRQLSPANSVNSQASGETFKVEDFPPLGNTPSTSAGGPSSGTHLAPPPTGHELWSRLPHDQDSSDHGFEEEHHGRGGRGSKSNSPRVSPQNTARSSPRGSRANSTHRLPLIADGYRFGSGKEGGVKLPPINMTRTRITDVHRDYPCAAGCGARLGTDESEPGEMVQYLENRNDGSNWTYSIHLSCHLKAMKEAGRISKGVTLESYRPTEFDLNPEFLSKAEQEHLEWESPAVRFDPEKGNGVKEYFSCLSCKELLKGGQLRYVALTSMRVSDHSSRQPVFRHVSCPSTEDKGSAA